MEKGLSYFIVGQGVITLKEGDWVENRVSSHLSHFGFIEDIYSYDPSLCTLIITRASFFGDELIIRPPRKRYDVRLAQLRKLRLQLDEDDIDELIDWSLEDRDQESFQYYTEVKKQLSEYEMI